MNLPIGSLFYVLICLTLVDNVLSLQWDFMFIQSFAKLFQSSKSVNIYFANITKYQHNRIVTSIKYSELHVNTPFKVITTNQAIHKTINSTQNKNYVLPLTIIHFFPIPLLLNDSYTFSGDIYSVSNIQDENNVFVFKIRSADEMLSKFINISNVNLKSNIYVYYPINRREYQVLEAYKLNKVMPILKKYFGTWSTIERGFTEANRLHKWERRSNMSGLNLRYSVAIQEPFIMDKTELDEG